MTQKEFLLKISDLILENAELNIKGKSFTLLANAAGLDKYTVYRMRDGYPVNIKCIFKLLDYLNYEIQIVKRK